MENKTETKGIIGVICGLLGVYWCYTGVCIGCIPENQMEKKMEHEMDTGITWGIIGLLSKLRVAPIITPLSVPY